MSSPVFLQENTQRLPSQPPLGQSTTPILPAPNVTANVPGIFGPDYSFTDHVPIPRDVGVYDGDSVDSIMSAGKAAAFYVDVIGFGAPSTQFSRGFPQLKPLGVNTFVDTGQICSNGARMWEYIEGIPTGNSLGAVTSAAISAAGMPKLRGLAPGILEDVQSALNPVPIVSAVFGTGSPVCTYQAQMVGDQEGAVLNSATGNWYVANPELIYCSDGSAVNKSTGKCGGGKPMQGRWVKSGTMSLNVYNNTTQTHCPNGFAKTNHRDGDCLKELQSTTAGFRDLEDRETKLLKMIGAVAGVLFLAAGIHAAVKYRSRG